jgi:hypothetical protein
MYVWSKAAPRGRHSEESNTNQEDSAPSVVISERSTDKQKRRKKKRVSLDDPLHVYDRGIQVRLKRWQRHVDNRAVDKGHTGSEGCGHEHPAPGSFRTRRAAQTRANYALVTRFLDRCKHDGLSFSGGRSTEQCAFPFLRLQANVEFFICTVL